MGPQSSSSAENLRRRKMERKKIGVPEFFLVGGASVYALVQDDVPVEGLTALEIDGKAEGGRNRKRESKNLPDLAAIGRIHGRVGGALESGGKGGQIDGSTVDAEARRGVGVRQKSLLDRVGRELRAP